MTDNLATFQPEHTATADDAELARVLEAYLADMEVGRAPSPVELIASHPHLAERLEGCLASLEFLEQAAGEVRRRAFSGQLAESLLDQRTALGDFRLLREIGRGGMGVVYEAEQLSLGRRVAVKILPFAAMLDERQLARFKNEARAAASLRHEHIVPVFYVGVERGVHYYAMQFIEGRSLAQAIADWRAEPPGPLAPSELTAPIASKGIATGGTPDTIGDAHAVATRRDHFAPAHFRHVAHLGVQAAEALHQAHESGVVHRDVKPSNLLVEPNGHLWVADFGLARVGSDAALTLTGDLLGTLRYMSPEQAAGKPALIDLRTDVYALGATLYELVALRPAFDADDRQQLLRQINDEEPPPLRRLNRAIPADLETIVLKAMAKEPASRYATAQDFADDLRRFLQHKPIAARRPTVVGRARKWAARHVALVAMVAGSLAVVAAAGAAAAFLTLRAYRSETEQRAAAEANLAVASQIIDRMLSQAADNRYWHGDLEQAEKLAAQATDFYEELLKHSRDADLRFRAAKAHGQVAQIWELVGRHENAGAANRRAGELLLELTTTYPDRLQYLSALASNYNHIGLVDWSINRPLAAEPSFRQAWEIFAELANRFPQEPTYQDGLARMLSNLGAVCYFSDRFDEAEECYRRADAITEHLPPELKNSAEGLASQAGSITSQAELARLRGQYDRALELLEAAIPLHQQSLEKWPTNPVALDCYFHTLWNIVECQLAAGRHAAAASAVERLVEGFPDRLATYHEGAAQLLRCAKLAQGAASLEPEGARTPNPPAASYRQRAHELIAKAPQATSRTPDTVLRLAWFLVTCEDESFRDAPVARELAATITKDFSERGEAWFVLALAHYRAGEWQAADGALHRSVQLEPDGKANGYDSLLRSMILVQEGRQDDARKSYAAGADWLAKNMRSEEDVDLSRLVLEAGLVQGHDHGAGTLPISEATPSK